VEDTLSGTVTVTVHGCGNISNVVHNGNAFFTLYFATAMPDASYCVSGSAGGIGGYADPIMSVVEQAASYVKIRTTHGNNVGYATYTNVNIFR
jgi:hypothetical protein